MRKAATIQGTHAIAMEHQQDVI